MPFRTSIETLVATASVALSMAGSPAAAAACLTGDGVPAIGAHALDGRTLRLEDGRDVRLLGISGGKSDDATTALASLTVKRPIVMHGAGTSDRWGRLQAWLYLPRRDGPQSIAEILLKQGAGHAVGTVGAPCFDLLLEAEREARDARRGIWATPGAILDATDRAGLLGHIGAHIIAEGRVTSARVVRDRLYVNFTSWRTRGLTYVIRKRAWPMLGADVSAAAEILKGRPLRVRGQLEWRGGPVIEANGIEPIERLGGRVSPH